MNLYIPNPTQYLNLTTQLNLPKFEAKVHRLKMVNDENWTCKEHFRELNLQQPATMIYAAAWK